MTRSRIIVGLAVLLVLATPLYLLSIMKYGVNYGMLLMISESSGFFSTRVAVMLWRFAPLDWWSYITPVALAVGVAARIRTNYSGPILSAMLAFSITYSAFIIGAFGPFVKFGSAMDGPETVSYSQLPLLFNVVMLVVASVFAAASVGLAYIDCGRKRRNLLSEQGGDGDAEEAV